MSNFEQRLDRLAEVAVKVGLRLQKGQDLVLTAPIAALPLVRRITEHAYKAGAGLVTPLFSDEETTLARYRYAPDESFDRAAGWLYDGMAKAFANNAARLAISGDNPMLLSAQDPAKVARANRAHSIAYKPALEKIADFDINWNIVSYPKPAWAKAVFPGRLPEDVAVDKLADAIFAASRVDVDDPIAAWETHNAALAAAPAWLNGKRFSALHFQRPGHRSDRRPGRRPLNGMAAPRRRRTASPAIPTSRPRKSSPRRTALRVEGSCLAAPSRCPIRAR